MNETNRPARLSKSSFQRLPVAGPHSFNMKTAHRFPFATAVVLVLFGVTNAPAQTPSRFNSIGVLTNREVWFNVSNAPLRVDATTSLGQWQPLVTFTPTASSITFTDTAAPYLSQRFYRAESVNVTNLSGDHLVTDDGDVVIRPVNHASLVLRWKDKTIYNDVVNGATPYVGMPRADLILVSHSHSDHFSSSTIDAVRGANAILIAPPAISNSLTVAQRSIAIFLTNGASTTAHGMTIDAVPAYNLTTSNHPKGIGNGYVVTIGGRRIFFSGDTEDVPEIRALTNIDMAFLCMNVPFTMTVDKAISTVRQFRPKVVYPYHYRNSDGTFADLNEFKRRVGQDLGIEVRLRRWY
jgi:L-ascorbate metabolism protein UlaG (beta-lactamase superfamily)